MRAVRAAYEEAVLAAMLTSQPQFVRLPVEPDFMAFYGSSDDIDHVADLGYN
jgi:hypothetical protein